ncbi:YceD family protein [Actinomyces gaoshouyii]|uniref:Metal-binding protein n=1 Tax=Actinomyces gaoshouyii TaxID=1960083 RepID=A0A8H9LLW5_9ACTO|nr:DUF177 domain-containing protein [Actinomyces gaoshouyii]ARD41500.1 metal-binding protein [Actinomyces gaoshouyii]GGO99115.1 hypothetical protein GCM10011612_15610 [Actinomyces gaoshouyii]
MTGLVVDILDLPPTIGATKQIHLDLAAPEDLGTEVIGAEPGSPLVVDAALVSMEDGVLVRGSARTRIHGECVRCLTGIDEDREITFDELYLLPDKAAEARADEEDEEADDLFVTGQTTIDLEPALRDALILGLPMRPLCRPDCAGLCSQCGERLDDLPADHHHDTIDPRWAALSELLPGSDEELD